MKKQKAITLISLVITIVVLIILSSIVIYLSLGNNGIFIRAKQAIEEYKNAQISEEKSINDLYSEMIIAINDNSKITISTEDLRKLIREEVQKEVKERDSAPIFIDFDNLLTTITEQGQSWQAPEDCVVIATLKVEEAYGANVSIDNIVVSAIVDTGSAEAGMSQITQIFYVKKGSIIKTRENHGVYNLNIYGIK